MKETQKLSAAEFVRESNVGSNERVSWFKKFYLFNNHKITIFEPGDQKFGMPTRSKILGILQIALEPVEE